MVELEVFKNSEFGEVRAVSIDGEPWFVGKDVAEILGYSNTRDALAKHVDAEDKGVAKCDTPSGEQEMAVINESGLYSLIMRSSLPSARQFTHWVTSEVLPSIRKHGMYKVYDDETAFNFLLENIKHDKGMYKRVFTKVLANSPLDVREVVEGYLIAIGYTEMPHLETKKMREFDDNRKRKREKIEDWEKSADNHYTEEDIPEWVRDKICTTGFGVYREYAIQDILFKLSKVPHNGYHYCQYNNTIHFSKVGYIRLIEYIDDSKMIAPWDIEQWKEQTGLFDQEK